MHNELHKHTHIFILTHVRMHTHTHQHTTINQTHHCCGCCVFDAFLIHVCFRFFAFFNVLQSLCYVVELTAGVTAHAFIHSSYTRLHNAHQRSHFDASCTNAHVHTYAKYCIWKPLIRFYMLIYTLMHIKTVYISCFQLPHTYDSVLLWLWRDCWLPWLNVVQRSEYLRIYESTNEIKVMTDEYAFDFLEEAYFMCP